MSLSKSVFSKTLIPPSPLRPRLPNPPRDTNYLYPLRPNLFAPPKGKKPVYLPNFTLTLLRTPHAPPHFATFLTPLYLNKLDLKDYLYHAYGLHVLSVRSYVQQAKVRMDKPREQWPAANRWFRPRATKKMTVELEQNAPGQGAFVWPDRPTDLTPWSKIQYEKSEAEVKENRGMLGADASKRAPKDGNILSMQARELVEASKTGKEKWRPGWMDFGGMRGGKEL